MIKYGYKNGPDGAEAIIRLLPRGRLYIQIFGSNSRKDYMDSLIAWPRIKTGGQKFHAYWFHEALLLYSFLEEILIDSLEDLTSLHIIGHSMGGAVAEILGWKFDNGKRYIDIRTVNAPKSGLKNQNFDIDRYVHRGDIIHWYPLFYPKSSKIWHYGKFQCLIKAHSSMPQIWNVFKNIIESKEGII